jgi:hypothetical protein
MRIDNSMHCLRGAACAALLLIAPAAAYAAPAGTVTRALADQARVDASIDLVAYRHCSWRNGVRHCRRIAARPRVQEPGTGYGYAYGTPRAEFYPTGSTAWWHAMEREGRVFRGPN